jgi:DNA-binding NtrC family response regulator
MNEEIAILLVDDDDTFREVLSEELASMGYRVHAAENGEEAQGIVANENVNVVLLDIKMPGMSGIEAIKVIKDLSPETEIIMLTAHATVDNAINSMKQGAYDFVTKPCNLQELESVIHRAYEKQVMGKENLLLKQELARREEFRGIIGKSQAIINVLELTKKVANTSSTVLIMGESGVGKELVAKAIHRNGPMKDGPFVIIDCGSLQENLLESELFGHEKGAYTGAVGRKHGLFEVADSGTLFMDEIGEIGPAIQVKLLRVMDTKTFRRMGSTKDIKVNVRIIAATNRDLYQMVKSGQFREDLFYRLNVISMYIPPLRERKDDIPMLAEHFIKHTNITGKKDLAINPDAMELLMAYSWPGNIRELQNVIERAMIMSEDNSIGPKDLPSNIRRSTDSETETEGDAHTSLREMEKRHILQVLESQGGHRGKTAKVLQISERTLYRKLKDYEIPITQPQDQDRNS